MKIFLIHGAKGHPKENWLPWLSQELEAKGALTFTPTFPTQGVSFDSWKKVFAQYHLDPSCILVGHSAGVPFILNLLEKEEVKAAVLVSGFSKKLENEYDPLVETFLKEFDWEAIKKNCQHFFVFHGDNDPLVSVEQGKFIAEQLGVEPIIIPNGGHLNEASGFIEFPQLLAAIKNVL
jgi:predicted alpha/beta hydrolase family esterase